jgi:hypothetical protein
MSDVLLEIIFDSSDYDKMGVRGRDEIEDPISDELTSAGIGEVTGGGAGSGVVIIDVEIENELHFDEGLQIIRNVLSALKCPRSTIIKRSKPSTRTYGVYDA